MAYGKLYVDGQLVNYGDDLFPAPYRSPKSPPPPPKFFSTFPDRLYAALMVRNNIKAVINRVPEVMVKITNRKDSGKGMGTICAHLDYISRNGKTELEDAEGVIYEGKKAVNYFKESWRATIPEESHRREAFNVMFSMPEGTHAESVKDAVRDFLREEFENHDYVFALHTDTKKPHVHVCINANPKRGRKRLNPRKADLQNWRVGFAERLRAKGIQANATPRRTRGQFKDNVPQSLPQSIYQMTKRQAEVRKITHYDLIENRRKSRIQIGHGQFSNYYGLEKSKIIQHARGSLHWELRAWGNIAQTVAESESLEDKTMAIGIVKFLGQTPVITQGGGIQQTELTIQKNKTPSKTTPLNSSHETPPMR